MSCSRPTTILALGLPLALTPDIGEHYYTQDVPQSDDYAEHQTRAARITDRPPPSTKIGRCSAP